jgi:hypothetical protein
VLLVFVAAVVFLLVLAAVAAPLGVAAAPLVLQTRMVGLSYVLQ